MALATCIAHSPRVRPSPPSKHVGSIVFEVARVQVVWVDAFTNIAVVTNKHRLFGVLVMSNKTGAMRVHVLAFMR